MNDNFFFRIGFTPSKVFWIGGCHLCFNCSSTKKGSSQSWLLEGKWTLIHETIEHSFGNPLDHFPFQLWVPPVDHAVNPVWMSYPVCGFELKNEGQPRKKRPQATFGLRLPRPKPRFGARPHVAGFHRSLWLLTMVFKVSLKSHFPVFTLSSVYFLLKKKTNFFIDMHEVSQ